MPLKIAAVTGTRADWGLLSLTLKVLKNSPLYDLKIIATGQHLMADDASSINEITADEFEVAKIADLELSDADDKLNITKACGRSIIKFADIYNELNPDVVLVLGDRYEILGAVTAALFVHIPVVHLCGGDITEGAIDDSIRHAITKMSHVHLVTNEDAQKRVLQMGENPQHVHVVGSPGLDQILSMEYLSREQFFTAINFVPKTKNLLITFHSVTMETDSQHQCRQMLEALKTLGSDVGFIFTGSNADPEGVTLTRMISDFVQCHDNSMFVHSLGRTLYLNALKHCNAVVGNSSSGLYEAPSFSIPTVNIGNRQKGRLKASSVIDALPEKGAITEAIKTALLNSYKDVKNPYGDGNTSQKIERILRALPPKQQLYKKKFHAFTGD